MLRIINLKVKREGKQILNGVNLTVNQGEIHAIMGPNGSGKSTLAQALMGHPDIEVLKGSKVEMDSKNLLKMEVNERAQSGLFLAFQYPVEIPGVSFLEFLRLAYNNIQKSKNKDARPLSPFKFRQFVELKMNELKMDTSFLERNLNEGFSGGEKKKAEILQMAILEPKYVILDETDSGLDVSALRTVAESAKILSKKFKMGMIVITHYKRILEYLKPQYVHVMVKGSIAKSGDYSLAEDLDIHGYEKHISN